MGQSGGTSKGQNGGHGGGDNPVRHKEGKGMCIWNFLSHDIYTKFRLEIVTVGMWVKMGLGRTYRILCGRACILC